MVGCRATLHGCSSKCDKAMQANYSRQRRTPRLIEISSTRFNISLDFIELARSLALFLQFSFATEERMSLLLESAGDSTRMSRNLISIPSVVLMCGSLSGRALRLVAFFAMIFFLLSDGGAWAANGLPLRVFLTSHIDQLDRRGFVRGQHFIITDFDVPSRMGGESSVKSIQMKVLDLPPAYFLLEQPADLSLAILPADAQNVVLARGAVGRASTLSRGTGNSWGVSAAKRAILSKA